MNPSDTPIMNAAMEWQDHRDLLAQIGLLERELSQAKAELAETRRLAEGMADNLAKMDTAFDSFTVWLPGEVEAPFTSARQALAAWEARKINT